MKSSIAGALRYASTPQKQEVFKMNKCIDKKTFSKIPVSPEWCFENVRSIEQWTHGYHRYPAKFLPNLVKKLIEDYTVKGDLVVDFFAGCGTTLVEAKVHGRMSVGVDINPVAELITRAKITPIDPAKLKRRLNVILAKLETYNHNDFSSIKVHERIDYWFTEENKSKIAFLYKEVLLTRDHSVRDFFLVSLSHILKNCSRWLQTGTKPQIDPNKNPSDPFLTFKSHSKKMMKKNLEFFEQLKKDKHLDIKCEIRLEDARKTSIRNNSVDAIITSPPYVTSYEYADIHQLTGYWFEYISELAEFRKRFIGTFFSLNQNMSSKSAIAEKTINLLSKKHVRTAREVANYFHDMEKVAKEMHRVLKPRGHACVVIGNTSFRDIRIKSAEIFAEILDSYDMRIVDVIKRSIPYKLIPTIRNKETGRFTKKGEKGSRLIYPEEYILIVQKCRGQSCQ